MVNITKNSSAIWSRLPLNNAYNVRELGGYPCGHDGMQTRWHAFLRSDILTYLDENDIDFLTCYNVRAVIDLRSIDEVTRHPDPFSGHPLIKYYNIPFVKGNIEDSIVPMKEDGEFDFGKYYITILSDASDTVRTIFETIAAIDGCVMFHCSAGKDRTGILAMLLLGLAGVSRQDIIANYEISYTYLQSNPFFNKFSSVYPKSIYYSKPEYISDVMQFIETKFGGYKQYLLSTGISEDTLDIVTAKICGD